MFLPSLLEFRPHKAHHALEFTRELLRDAIPRKGSFEKNSRVPCRKNLERWGDKKRTGCDGIRENGAASSHRCSCCRQEKRTVISPFQPQRDSRATRERYTRAMCSVLDPEAELMESPFMMQRGEFGVHSLS